jgi:hypothetical protein
LLGEVEGMAGEESTAGSVEGFVAEVRGEWRCMWKERIDDPVRAEGIAGRDYDKLFVERGTVVLATRNFKLLTLKGILEQHKIENAERFAPTSPYGTGMRRFGRAYAYKRLNASEPKKAAVDKQRQLKKGGRGWLHI